MRSVPFKVVCLLGMTDTDFPRHESSLAFDQIAQHPQAGDRNLRDDDRQLFLEAILSARDVLYLSYSGLSARAKAEAPPSVVVSELLDYLGENFRIPDRDVAQGLITRHPLQAFDVSYFQGGRLFTFSEENWRANRAAMNARTVADSFAVQAIGEPEGEWQQVTLQQLINFFCHPAKFFLTQRLGMRLPPDPALPDECEPMELDKLAATIVLGESATAALAGLAGDTSLALARAGGRLPHGTPGSLAHSRAVAEVIRLLEDLQPVLATAELPSVPLDLQLGPWRLTGILDGLHASAQLQWRAAALTPRDQLRAWIRHLLLNTCGAQNAPRETHLFSLEGKKVFKPLDDAPTKLLTLLQHYADGLRRPLRFFPRTSFKFAELDRTPGKHAQALIKARAQWESGKGEQSGESEDPFNRVCFRGEDPLDSEWERLARSICQPLFDSLRGS